MYRRFVKRGLDFILSLAGIIVLSPVFLILAVLVRCKLGSPVLFKQERPGKDEKIFTLCKFRTMTDRRDAEGKLLPDSQRLPHFGKLLRATSLDELPELLNILKGDMSIIGPRPLLVSYLPYYTEEERMAGSGQRQKFYRLGQTDGKGCGICKKSFFCYGCKSTVADGEDSTWP